MNLSRLRAIAAPLPAGASPPDDPIYAVIAAHQSANRGHLEAVEAENAYEEAAGCRFNMNAEQARTFARLEEMTSATFDHLKGLSLTLVTTKPTTTAGIGAVCRYVKSLLFARGLAGLLLEDDHGTATFCDTIAAAIEAMS